MATPPPNIIIKDHRRTSSTATQTFLRTALPVILRQNETLNAFLPLLGIAPSPENAAVVAARQRVLNLFTDLTIVVPADSEFTSIPSGRTLYLNPEFANQLDGNQPTLAANPTKHDSLDAIQKHSAEGAEDKFLIIGALIHSLGHYVHSQNKTLKKWEVGGKIYPIVDHTVSLIDENPNNITEADAEEIDEQAGQPTGKTPTALDPGQVVELGVFGVVADFDALRDGTVQNYLFRHREDFTGLDKEPIGSRRVFKKIWNTGNTLKPIELADLQYGGTLPTRYRESPYRRVGFGVLNLTHPSPFCPKLEEEHAPTETKQRKHPQGWVH